MRSNQATHGLGKTTIIYIYLIILLRPLRENASTTEITCLRIPFISNHVIICMTQHQAPLLWRHQIVIPIVVTLFNMIVSFIDFVEGLPVLIHLRRVSSCTVINPILLTYLRRVPDTSKEANSYIALEHIRSEQKAYILSYITYFINISVGETIE